jgi:hypothetical protein
MKNEQHQEAVKVHFLRLSDALLQQVIYGLQVRVRELNSRPDLDSELLVNTQAALEAACSAKEGKS